MVLQSGEITELHSQIAFCGNETKKASFFWKLRDEGLEI
jgi:hypothetical protein